MKKSYIYFIVLVTLAVALVAITFSGNDEKAVAEIDGKKIYANFDQKNASDLAIYGEMVSQEDNVVQVIRRELIKREVERLGLGISEQQYNEYIEEVRKSYNFDKDIRAIFDKSLEIQGITEEEFFSQQKQFFYDMFSAGLYKTNLRNEFIASRPEIAINEIDTLFDEYYNNHLKELQKTYNVIIYK